jgi:Domain of unknown function (DUF4326)
MPERIQLRRAKGWRMPEGAIKVDRSTRWGNIFWPGQRVIAPGAYGSLASPYHGCRPSGLYQFGSGGGPRDYEIRRVKDAAESVALFASYVQHDPSGWPPDDIRCSLGGADLACWCDLPVPGEPDICHCTVLLALANGRELPSWLLDRMAAMGAVWREVANA